MEDVANKKHIALSVLVATILIVFSLNASKCHGDGCSPANSDTANILDSSIENEYKVFPKMFPEKINEQINNKEITLLDVREDFEWDEGHIAGAKHIALGDIDFSTTKELPKNLPIYVYCRSGNRAREAEQKLISLGFEKVENIGGIIHWQERGGTLVK